MKFRIFLFLLICSFFSSVQLSAQSTRADKAKDRAENRANNKVNNKVDRSVDTAVDDAFNAIGGLFKKKDKKKEQADPAANESSPQASDANTSAPTGGLFGGNWEAYTNPRNFSLNWNMVTTKRNGKQEKLNMEIAVIETQTAIHLVNPDKPSEESCIILDTESGKTTMISTDNKGEKSGVRMRLPNMQQSLEKELAKQNDAGRWNIERTGERMTIDGYDCEKYIVTDTETGDVTTSWVTQDLDLSWKDISMGMAGGFGGGGGQSPMSSIGGHKMEGVMIKGTSVTKKETIDIHITQIKTDAATDISLFDLSGIEIQDTGF